MAFPVSPTEGQTYTENNTVWIYSSTAQQWFRSQVNPENETFYEFGGSATATGNAGEIQYTDGTNLAASPNLVWDDVNDELEVGGDVVLDDGGTFTTTLQTVTPTQNRTISFPDATGTVGLVAGSSGQLVYNNAGAYAGVPSSVVGATGNITLSLNGATGVPPVAVTGTWFAGTTPQVLIQPSNVGTAGAWSASGTGLGVNAPAAFGGNLLDLQVNGTSNFNVASTGAFVAVAGSSGINNSGFIGGWNGGAIGFSSSASWAPTVTLDTMLRRDGSGILAQRNGNAAQAFRVYNTFTSATNYELGKLEWASNVFRIGTEKGSGGGTARALEFQTDGTTRWTVSASSGSLQAGANAAIYLENGGIGRANYSYISFPTVDGNILLSNWNANGFGRLQFGGTTSSFPALKRNAAVLETKLADDSAYAQHAASVFQAATAHTVATLPGTPAVGMIARVTDATAPAVGSTVTGGGAAAALVWYNGANWSVIGV
jgi:hypothetical protein